MRKIFVALILSIIFTSQAYSKEPSKEQIIPLSRFGPVIVEGYDVRPESTLAPSPSINPTHPRNVVHHPFVPSVQKLTSQLTGIASWYCDPPNHPRCTIGHKSGGYYAAIRRDLLDLRGKIALVCYQTRCVRVEIIDCLCSGTRLIDLYSDAFRELAPLGTGLITVTMQIVGG